MTAFKRGYRGRLRIHLHDEAPRIGCGVRLVDIHIGNKRVTLRDPATKHVARIPRKVFERIASTAL